MESFKRKYLSWDVEISDIFELKKGEDIEEYAPFHISVAASATDAGEDLLWYSHDPESSDIENVIPAKDITSGTANALLNYLRVSQEDGYMICAWNGLHFDFKWLGFAADNMKLAAELALKSIDPMFQFFNLTGFPVGLASVAKGFGIERTKLMDGANAPKEWCDGNYEKVKEYVMGDCYLTNDVIEKILESGRIRWITKKGKKSSRYIGELKTVQEVIDLPMADQGWMDTPLKKENFYGWTREEYT